MQANKELLIDFPAFFGAAVAEIREEERKKHEEGIFNFHQKLGLTVVQIANTMELPIEYVQSIIDKNAI